MESVSDDICIARALTVLKSIFGNNKVPQVRATPLHSPQLYNILTPYTEYILIPTPTLNTSSPLHTHCIHPHPYTYTAYILTLHLHCIHSHPTHTLHTSSPLHTHYLYATYTLPTHPTYTLHNLHHLLLQPRETVVTRWRSDVFARGSYSYVAAGSTG